MKQETTKKETKKEVITIAKAFREVARLGCKSKTELLKQMAELLASHKIIATAQQIGRQVSAMIYDISKKKGGWKDYTYTTTKEGAVKLTQKVA